MKRIRELLPSITRKHTPKKKSLSPSNSKSIDKEALATLIVYKQAQLDKPHGFVNDVKQTMVYVWLLEQTLTETDRMKSFKSYSDWEPHPIDDSQTVIPWSTELYTDLTKRFPEPQTHDCDLPHILKHTEYKTHTNSPIDTFKITEYTNQYISQCFNHSVMKRPTVNNIITNRLFTQYDHSKPATAHIAQASISNLSTPH